MKKIIILFVVLSIFSIAFYGCKKDNNSQNQFQQLSTADQKLSNMIENFKEKGSLHLKSGEEMTTDSAIWYLNVTANYTYGDASIKTEKISIDSIFITLPVSDGKVPFETVFSKYEEMIGGIRSNYQNLPDNTKQLMAVSIKQKSVTDDATTLKVTSTFATGPNYHLFDFDPNGSGWHPIGALWHNGGTCDGQYLNRDAATEIQSKIMFSKAVPSGNYYYAPVMDTTVIGIDFFVPGFTGNPNYGGTYIYYNNEYYPGYQHCLSPQECNFYLNGTKHIIYDTHAQGGIRPIGMDFISVSNMHGDVCLMIPGWCAHWATIAYGVLHVSPNPPEAL